MVGGWSVGRRRRIMAIISQNRTLIPLCSPYSPFKLRKTHRHHPLLNLSPPPPPHLHNNNNMNSKSNLPNTRVTTISASALTPKTTVDNPLQFQQDSTSFTSTADFTSKFSSFCSFFCLYFILLLLSLKLQIRRKNTHKVKKKKKKVVFFF